MKGTFARSHSTRIFVFQYTTHNGDPPLIGYLKTNSITVDPSKILPCVQFHNCKSAGVEISAGPGPVDSTSGQLGPHLAGPPGQ